MQGCDRMLLLFHRGAGTDGAGDVVIIWALMSRDNVLQPDANRMIFPGHRQRAR